MSAVWAGENNTGDDVVAYFFYSSSCPHCADERPFLEELERKYPRLKIEYLESYENMEFFGAMCGRYNCVCGHFPTTFIGDMIFIGFSPHEGDLVYIESYGAYRGCPNQIENAIRVCFNLSCKIPAGQVIEISRGDSLVQGLLKSNYSVVANIALVNDTVTHNTFDNQTFVVGWWTYERLRLDIQYPDVVVFIDPVTGVILGSGEPTEPIKGLSKPVRGLDFVQIFIYLMILLYFSLYLVFSKKVEKRYWVAAGAAVAIISVFAIVATTPDEKIEAFAKKFPFPLFVVILALLDGFNPCAFTVLVVLLSLLTHTRSKKRMGVIGFVFILTSGVVYFIAIMFVILLISSLTMMVAEYEELMWKMIGAGVLIAGSVNLKDFFLPEKGVTLSISDEHRNEIFRRAGGITRQVQTARTTRALAMAVVGVVFLALFVNLVELGCSLVLPAVYADALRNECRMGSGQTINILSECFLEAIFYTALYCVVYVMPLFVILLGFLHTFKSRRLTEKQGRLLKLVGGLVMFVLGIIMIFKPELLMFG
ncbi:MAG: hypothetical protein KAU03_04140 [Candidatus Altiarchaeales archaeon]|nr:hypothetical protein [Candidatus Altiarchaeales archaeon]